MSAAGEVRRTEVVATVSEDLSIDLMEPAGGYRA
jgi:hypothetical protein